jgi:hypothetical protein
MNFIQLPSGLIINLDQVAYVHNSEEEWTVCFPAAGSTGRGAQILSRNLDAKDAEVFIKVLENAGMRK